MMWVQVPESISPKKKKKKKKFKGKAASQSYLLDPAEVKVLCTKYDFFTTH